MNHAESLHHSQLNIVSQWNPVDQWNLVSQWNPVDLWNLVSQWNPVDLWNLVYQWNPVDQWNLVYQWNFVCLDEVPGMELHGPKKLNDISRNPLWNHKLYFCSLCFPCYLENQNLAFGQSLEPKQRVNKVIL